MDQRTEQEKQRQAAYQQSQMGFQPPQQTTFFTYPSTSSYGQLPLGFYAAYPPTQDSSQLNDNRQNQIFFAPPGIHRPFQAQLQHHTQSSSQINDTRQNQPFFAPSGIHAPIQAQLQNHTQSHDKLQEQLSHQQESSQNERHKSKSPEIRRQKVSKEESSKRKEDKTDKNREMHRGGYHGRGGFPGRMAPYPEPRTKRTRSSDVNEAVKVPHLLWSDVFQMFEPRGNHLELKDYGLWKKFSNDFKKFMKNKND